MLTPEYLDTLPDALVALWQQVEDDILRDIARRIAKTGTLSATVAWQAWRLEQTRALHSDVTALLVQYSGKSRAVIRRLLREAGASTLSCDDALYRSLGFAPSSIDSSPALNNLLNAGYRQTWGEWRNLTATTARTVTGEFERALDRAWLQVSSGAFDYNTAIRRAVDRLAGHMAGVTYPSGHTDTLEVAARRAVLTGVNQTAAQLQLARAEEMDCEFVEVTAHPDARPDHALWQGKVYHVGGAAVYDGERYEDFSASTGYGTGAGLCGWNCRHNFYPFFPGLSQRNYSDHRLAELNAKEIDYNGEKYTRYEIRQMQRALERKVRAAKRRFLAEDAAGLDAGEAAARLRQARAELKGFIRQTGGRADSARTAVQGFGRNATGKATAAGRRSRASLADGNTANANGYAVTEEVIANAPKPAFRGLSNRMNDRAQQYGRALLQEVQGKPLGTEATVSFAADGSATLAAVGADAAARVGVQDMAVPYYTLHNHASNAELSPEDVWALMKRDTMRGIGAYGNNGALFTCEKVFGYDAEKAVLWYNELKKKYPRYKNDMAQRLEFAKELRTDGKKHGLNFV